MKCNRALWAAALIALLGGCGMAERDDEDRKSYDYLTLHDEAFAQYCLKAFDTNRDGRLSRYEAESVRQIECRDRGIRSLDQIDAFSRLEIIDCSGNELESLDLTKNRELQRIHCANNKLRELSLGSLRRLTELDCRKNLLTEIDLAGNASLQRLDCRNNAFSMLDLSPCSVLLKADVRSNPHLSTVYYRAGQQVNYEAPTVLFAR